MSVVSTKEIHDGRGGGDDLENDGGKSNATRQFRVITNSAYDGADTVLQSCDNLGVVHPSANWLYVKTRRAKNHSKSKLVWTVTLTYTSHWERTENPFAQPAEVSWNTETSQENAYKDITDEAILNSAGDYYEDGVPVDAARWVAKVKKNIPFMPSWINNYRDAINSDNFWLDGLAIGARTAKLSGISVGVRVYQNGIWFRQIDMTIKIKESWAFSILDQGLRRIVDTGDGDRLEKCLNEDGTAATKPCLLDGSGAQLTTPTPSTAVFNTHYIYPELPFSALPIY